MKKRNYLKFLPIAILVLLLFNCKSNQNHSIESKNSEVEITKAICVLSPTEGNNVKGIVTFTKVEKGIQVNADINGLVEGKHGFHIHEFGDISSLDGKSAGGHFNPQSMEHGGFLNNNRHVGDMGNIVADKEGNAHLELLDTKISFTGPNSIIGRAIIVHADEDDLKTQPTGNAGARVAYGVIGITIGNENSMK